MLPKLPDRFTATDCLAYELHVCLIVDNGSYPLQTLRSATILSAPSRLPESPNALPSNVSAWGSIPQPLSRTSVSRPHKIAVRFRKASSKAYYQEAS